MREELAVTPCVALIQLLGAHVFGLKHYMRGVVSVPVTVQDAPLALELTEQRGPGIRSQYVEGCALQSVRLDPLNGSFENVRPIVIESEHEAAVHLDSVAVEDRHTARIVLRRGGPLAR